MQDKGLFEFKSFTGHLHANGSTTALTFSVRIDHAGEVEFDLGTIALTSETKFIMDYCCAPCQGAVFQRERIPPGNFRFNR